MKDHGTRSFAAYHMAAIVTLCLALGAVESAAAAGPVTGLDLVLWLDAQDIEGNGNASNQPPQGQAIAAWADKR